MLIVIVLILWFAGALNGLHLYANNYICNMVSGVGGTLKGLHLDAIIYLPMYYIAGT